jgi:hypothetical protein
MNATNVGGFLLFMAHGKNPNPRLRRNATEFRNQVPDAAVRWLEASFAYLILNAEGNFLKNIAFRVDISGKRRIVSSKTMELH